MQAAERHSRMLDPKEGSSSRHVTPQADDTSAGFHSRGALPGKREGHARAIERLEAEIRELKVCMN